MLIPYLQQLTINNQINLHINKILKHNVPDVIMVAVVLLKIIQISPSQMGMIILRNLPYLIDFKIL
jgi:hypothetical protein